MWNVPVPATTGELYTAARYNTDVIDNILTLKTSQDDAGNYSPPVSTLVISGDAVTPSLGRHRIDTEAAAATDDLKTLTIPGSGIIRDGHFVILSSANASRVVTVKHGTGNIQLKSGDFALSVAATSSVRFLTLQLWGTLWWEIARSDQDGSLANNQVFVGTTITTPTLAGYREKKIASSIISNVLTLDFYAGNWFEVTINANWTLATTNVPPSGMIGSFNIITIGNGTDYTDTWPAGIKWVGGVAPTVTFATGKKDIFNLMYDPSISQWFGFVVGQNM